MAYDKIAQKFKDAAKRGKKEAARKNKDSLPGTGTRGKSSALARKLKNSNAANSPVAVKLRAAAEAKAKKEKEKLNAEINKKQEEIKILKEKKKTVINTGVARRGGAGGNSTNGKAKPRTTGPQRGKKPVLKKTRRGGAGGNKTAMKKKRSGNIQKKIEDKK
jgi:hypothetical protein